MENVNGLCKAECIRTTVFHDRPHKSIATAGFAVARWADWYNNRVFHPSLGYVPPAELEQAPNGPSTESRNPHRSV
jgi:transposase InsO family protein